MPKKTFSSLNEEKKNKLLKCAKEEFGKMLYEDVSINKIIQNAEISRGSFYMYFEDKKDLYLYLVDNYKNYLINTYLEILKANDGDFIKSWMILYNKLIKNIPKLEDLAFIKNIYLNMKLSSEKIGPIKPSEEQRSKFEKELLKYIDKNKYKYSSDEDLICSFELLMIMTNTSLARIFLDFDQKKEIKKYERMVNILSYGVYKEEFK